MNQPFREIVRGLCCCLPAACLPCGCIDSTVDDSDLDKQIGINVDGLKVRLGNTEKMKLADLLKPEGHVKQDAKGIYDLVEQGNTSFDFTFRHRVPAVGHFEMNNRPQNTKPPLSEGERRFCFAEKMTLARRRGIAPTNGVQRSRGAST